MPSCFIFLQLTKHKTASLAVEEGQSFWRENGRKKGEQILLVVHKPGAGRGFMGVVFTEGGEGGWLVGEGGL